MFVSYDIQTKETETCVSLLKSMGMAHIMTIIKAVQVDINKFCLKLQTGIFHANMSNHE